MFQPVSPKTDVQQVEQDQMDFWKQKNVFKRTMSEREKGQRFVFYEGPPTANGRPGTHHVLARSFKDIFPRYKTMRGYYVLRKGGWDTHGLPVEIEVEKELGLKHKHEIDAYGIAAFNEKCRESVFRYIKEWEKLTERIAYWVDLDEAYITYKNEYIQSVWWILSEFWKQGLLFQGHKVVPYCPRCGTPLSSHEVNMGYKDDTPDPSVYVRFKSKDQADTYFLVWTTTPWTLPGNVALAVGKGIDYVRIEGEDEGGKKESLILAEARLDAALGDRRESYQVVEKLKGEKLLGTHYEPLFTFLPVEQDYAYVVAGDFVSTEDGTGIVHMAPAFGADDLAIGTQYNLPVLMTVNPEGNFIDEVTPWAGQWVKDADKSITKELKGRGLLYSSGIYKHTYPFCWRCDTPLLYYARPTWYIRTTARNDDLVNLNKTINWTPEHVRDGRFGNWLENNVDWALGRERYWGTPLPVWICDDCGHQQCVSGVQDLSALTGSDQSELELHRPYVDDVTWTCKECSKGTMRRVPELIDVWFDSGAMFVAQWGYPFKNEEMFKEQFPADYICEAVDQTRGWFYSLHAISSLLYKSVSYKNVICLGHLLDERGHKHSKSKGNAVDPWSVLNLYGADTFRWYMFTASPPGDARRFSLDLVGQVYRSFWMTLWSTYNFFVTYANLDGFDPTQGTVKATDRSQLDRWILAELHTLVRDVTAAFEDYDVTGATRPIERFVVDLLSNWYVRRSRPRFWKSEDDTDKRAAQATLYECLVTVAKLLAPAMPFVSDALYRNLVASVDSSAPDSVHLAEWPTADEKLVDQTLLDEMRLVMRLVKLGHAARNSAQVKVRQPLADVGYSLPAEQAAVVEAYASIIADELNVKSVGALESAEGLVSYTLNPLPEPLGKRFKGDFPKVQKALKEGDHLADAQALLAGKTISVRYNDLDMAELSHTEVEVKVQPTEGYAVAQDGPLLAALNIVLTDDLQAEGLAREFIRRVQTMRKDADFAVDDRITVTYSASQKLARAVEQFAEMIQSETLTTDLKADEKPSGDKVEQHEVDGEALRLGVKRV